MARRRWSFFMSPLEHGFIRRLDDWYRGWLTAGGRMVLWALVASGTLLLGGVILPLVVLAAFFQVHAGPVAKMLKIMPKANGLVEFEARNNAPAIALACAHVAARNPQGMVARCTGFRKRWGPRLGHPLERRAGVGSHGVETRPFSGGATRRHVEQFNLRLERSSDCGPVTGRAR